MIERTNIKEAFGGEVPFTNYIAATASVKDRLLEVLELETDDAKITAESHTKHNKRVDLIASEGKEVVAVIESQDVTGWLDPLHASKLTYYMYDKNCYTGVLLAEDADEHIKGYIRMLNEKTPFDVWLINTPVYKVNNETYVDFIPVMRPLTTKDKKVRSVSSTDNTENYKQRLKAKWTDFLAEKFEEHEGVFTNKTSLYLSKNGVGSSKINVTITARVDGFAVQAYKKTLGIDLTKSSNFVDSFNKWSTSLGRESFINKHAGYVPDVATWDEAFEIFQSLVENIQNDMITI